MLLRTSSAPVLGSLRNPYFPQTDTCKDSMELLHLAHSSSLSAFKSVVAHSALPSHVSWDGHGICGGNDSSEGELDQISHTSRLSRAQSEGDLTRVSAGAVASGKYGFSANGIACSSEKIRRVSRFPSPNAISSFDVTESIVEEVDEPEQLPLTSSFLLHNFTCHGNDAISDAKFAHAFVLSDGECYFTVKLSASGSPLACNDKGCRPLTHSEYKELGFLDMASGVGVGAHAWNEQDERETLDVSNKREASYQSLLQRDPENPLLLRNYAQFLSKKGDVKKAEEYYERAILADPNDGEVLSQYAKLQWDVNRDQERAEAYYNQAVNAAPADWLEIKVRASKFSPWESVLYKWCSLIENLQPLSRL